MADAAEPPASAPTAENPAGATTSPAHAPAVKESASATLIKAAEHVVIESATAIAKDLATKNAADLKVIEKGLSQEVVAETKDGVPSLAEIGEAIVDGVEVVAEEVVEGAEIAIDAVKAHPELIAEAAIAVGVGVASLVQPELIVGSVAMIGKMAADSAKKTASDIAVTASTHVVNEIGKDITEDIANDAKVEATSTKTEVTQKETKVDEEKGVVVKTETKATSQKTQVVATGIVKPVTEASSDVVPEDGKDAEAVDSAQKEGEASESPVAEVAKESSSSGGKEGTSVIVTGGGDKKVSVKISDDGTITIGTDSSSEKKEVTETPIEVTPAAAPPEKGKEPGKEEVPLQDNKTQTPEVKTPLPEPEKATVKKPVDDESKKVAAPDAVPEQQTANTSTASSPSQETSESKAVPDTEEPNAEPAKPTESKTEGVEVKAVKVVLKTQAQAPTEPAPEAPQPTPPATTEPQAGDTHIHDSLAKLHEKLDTLLAASTIAAGREPTKQVEVTNGDPKITSEDLERIHLKLNNMQQVLAITPASESDNGVQHIHQKLDAIHTVIISNPLKDIKIVELHQKFDTMQTTLNLLTATLSLSLNPQAQTQTQTPEPETITSAKSGSSATSASASRAKSIHPNPDPDPEPSSPSPPQVEDSAAVAKKADCEPRAGPSNAVGTGIEGDNAGVDVGVQGKTKTKHVKRSSYFGGLFG